MINRVFALGQDENSCAFLIFKDRKKLDLPWKQRAIFQTEITEGTNPHYTKCSLFYLILEAQRTIKLCVCRVP